MHLVCVFVVLCSFLGQHVCSRPDTNNSNKLYDAGWRCDSVCFGSGGRAEFDPKNKVCKCTLDKNIDDTDQGAVVKNANSRGVHLILKKPLDKKVAKREVDAAPQHGENIVGQRTPQRIITPRPPSPIRQLSIGKRPTLRTTTRRPIVITSPRRRLSTGKSMNAQQRLQQLQEQINERRKSRTRNRTGPNLQMRAGIQEETTPNLMERLKEKRKERLEQLKIKSQVSKSGPLNNTTKTAGQAFQSAATNQENGEVEKKAKEHSETSEKKSHELITQDPSLYNNMQSI